MNRCLLSIIHVLATPSANCITFSTTHACIINIQQTNEALLTISFAKWAEKRSCISIVFYSFGVSILVVQPRSTHSSLPSSPALTISFSTPTSAPACLTPNALPKSSATWAATSTPTSSTSVAVPTGNPKFVVILSNAFGPTPSCK